MFKRSGSLVIVAACLTSLAALRAQEAPRYAGATKTGFLLPNGWVVSPVGEQVPVADLPLNILPLPDSRHVLVATSGYNAHELSLIDLEKKAVVDRQAVRESWFGLAASPRFDRIWWSGGGGNIVHRFELDGPKLARKGTDPRGGEPEESEGSIDGLGDPAALVHELPEGGRRDRLGTVADGVFWVVVNLEDQGVGAGGDSGPGHRDDELRFAGAVRRIDDDRQVTLVVKIGHRGQRQGEPGVVLVGADAPLAEHDAGIAPVEDVLGGKQELLQGRAHPALQQCRFTRVAHGLEQLVVLHVAGTDLEHVGVLGDHGDMLRSHDLGDNRQSGFGPRGGQHLQPQLLVALKAVGAGPGLERAAPQTGRAEILELRGPGPRSALRSPPNRGQQ